LPLIVVRVSKKSFTYTLLKIFLIFLINISPLSKEAVLRSHPDLLGWDASDNGEILDILGDKRACGYYGSSSYYNVAYDNDISTYPNIVLDDYCPWFMSLLADGDSSI
jgi:hypothetical protein